MDEITLEVPVFSPRWGHDDIYTITLSRESMKITHHPRGAICRWVENQDPEWQSTDGSLFGIFRNDSVTAPENFLDALEILWLNWRNGEINNEQVNDELKALFEWLNITTKSKPKTDYWRRVF